MKDLKTILERKDDTMVTLPRWAEVIRIDMDKEQIEFLENKEVPQKVKDNLSGIGSSYADAYKGLYVCIV